MIRKGFSIIETIVSAAILLSVSFSAAALVISAKQCLSKSMHNYAACQNMSNYMETVMVLDYEQVSQLNDATFCSGEGDVRITEWAPDVQMVELQIRTKPGNKEMKMCWLKSK